VKVFLVHFQLVVVGLIITFADQFHNSFAFFIYCL
jgi:hypothetical protein